MAAGAAIACYAPDRNAPCTKQRRPQHALAACFQWVWSRSLRPHRACIRLHTCLPAESSLCTKYYGFWGELSAKFPRGAARNVYNAFKRVFALLPLAACIQGQTLVVHGGEVREGGPRGAVQKGGERRGRKGRHAT